MNDNTFAQFWKQRVGGEKRALASHLRACYADTLRLTTPTALDADDTAAECLTGSYRKKMDFPHNDGEGVVNGHAEFPRRRTDYYSCRKGSRTPSTAASSSCGLCSECNAANKNTKGVQRSGANTPGGRSGSQPRSRVGSLRSSASLQRISGQEVLSQRGVGGGQRSGSASTIGFYNDSKRVENVRPLTGSSMASSLPSSASKMRPTTSSTSLEREVEILVRQEMERMVQPLQEELLREREGREKAEKEIANRKG